MRHGVCLAVLNLLLDSPLAGVQAVVEDDHVELLLEHNDIAAVLCPLGYLHSRPLGVVHKRVRVLLVCVDIDILPFALGVVEVYGVGACGVLRLYGHAIDLVVLHDEVTSLLLALVVVEESVVEDNLVKPLVESELQVALRCHLCHLLSWP